jgi:hypothetical protein
MRSRRRDANFLQDVRSVLIALSAWGFLAVLVDIDLFTESPLSLGLLLMVVVARIPFMYMLTDRRWLRASITLFNLLVTLLAAWAQSPKAY